MVLPQEIDGVLKNLERAPGVLRGLIEEIPETFHKQNRIPGKWSIHSHACHLIAVQPMILARLNRFLKEDKPEFKPYIPEQELGEAALLQMDLNESLELFPEYREELFERVKKATPEFFSKPSHHHEYREYTPFIMLRHIMMHDYLHMYRIEELWLTRDEYLPIPK